MATTYSDKQRCETCGEFPCTCKEPKRKTGTREWSEHSVNCATGCRHGCLYCYARWREVERFHRVKPGQWENEHVREAAVLARYPKYSGVVMFPTAHDITPPVGGGPPTEGPDEEGTLNACIVVLRKLLQAGNQVLIVSKPHLECVKTLCQALADYGDQIEFRFTITTLDKDRAAFWEPNAPPLNERYSALLHATTSGWRASVSMEPMLDVDVDEVADAVEMFERGGAETIWLGCMNDIRRRTMWVVDRMLAGERENERQRKLLGLDGPSRGRLAFAAELERLEAGYRVDNLRAIYERLRGNPKVRWKDSIQKALGLAGPTG